MLIPRAATLQQAIDLLRAEIAEKQAALRQLEALRNRSTRAMKAPRPRPRSARGGKATGRPGKPVAKETIAAVRRGLRAGLSVRAIARRLGMPQATLHRIVVRLKLR